MDVIGFLLFNLQKKEIHVHLKMKPTFNVTQRLIRQKKKEIQGQAEMSWGLWQHLHLGYELKISFLTSGFGDLFSWEKTSVNVKNFSIIKLLVLLIPV